MPPETTPMMQQYLRMKELHPDCILFFRLGDFYEMFNEDAKLVSKELELTLTSRDRGKPEAQRTPMCGVPYHSADAYIARLIAKGYKVAICEQMEDPALAKGLVDRDIIRIITPGTVMTSSMLEEGRNNFICAVYRDSAGTGLCFCDISTGECSVTSFTGPEADEHLYNELGRFTPREAMLSDGAYSDGALVDFLVKRLDCRCENGGEARFRLDAARTAAEKQFSAGLDALPAGDDAALQAVGGLLSYLYETQKTDLSHLSTLTYFTTGQFMELDLTARRNLELTETLRSKEKKGSLLWVLDKTRTAMGHRLIRAWMERPLLSPAAIGRRLGAVGELVGDAIGREELTLTLREITDLERLIGRIVYGTAGGRDLVALANGLGRLPPLRERLAGCSSALLASPAGGAGRSHRAAGAHRPGYRGRAPLLRPGGRLHPGGLPPGGGPPAGHYGQRKGPGGLHRGQGEGEDRHQEPEGGLQQGLRLLHRGVQVLLRPGARHLHPQADPHQLRAVHHPGAQGAGARDPLRPGPHHRPGV